MNRYRTIPGQGPPKASTSTTCQKCLKKDDYECKAGAQDRPYASRPSRTQQLLNPKLKPRLTNDTPNELLRKEGIADEQLASAEAVRNAASQRSRSRSPREKSGSARQPRSRSVSSDGSVSTISTSRSRSKSPSPHRGTRTVRRRPTSKQLDSLPAKRKHREFSSSPHLISLSESRTDEQHKSRRYNSRSPSDRGRPTSDRRGSHRSKSQSSSLDRSAATRSRRSLDAVPVFRNGVNDDLQRGEKDKPDRFGDHPTYRTSYDRTSRMSAHNPPKQRERSLSPFSKRLALTQAMNMDR